VKLKTTGFASTFLRPAAPRQGAAPQRRTSLPSRTATFAILPFWHEFGIIVLGTAFLFIISLWIASRVQKRKP
jgi:hypothetical protein